MDKYVELLGNKTIPGIYSVAKTPHKIIKLLWLVSSITLMTWCGMFLTDSVMSYFEFDVVTNIDVYRETEPPFPAISFCLTFDTNYIPPLNESLLSCTFNYNECDISDFSIYSIFNEVCYRFNSGVNYSSTTRTIKGINRFGTETSLQATFIIKDYKRDLFGNYIGHFKMSIFINNQSEIFRRDKAYNIENGFLIPSGLNYISIERQFVQKLPEPYNSCIKQDDSNYVSNLYQYFIKNNFNYLQKDCFDLCLEEIIINDCNCSVKLGKISSCLSDETKDKCIFGIYFDYYYSKRKLPEICFIKCPQECDSIEYKFNQNYFGTLRENYINLFNWSKTVIDEIIYVNIFYSSLEYTQLKQIPKQKVFDLVSNIGGTLGLFIGISFISFVEVIEIIIDLIFLVFSKHNVGY